MKMIAIMFIVVASAVLLIIMRSVLISLSVKKEDDNGLEIYHINKLNGIIARIRFVVLAIPIIMMTYFAIDNIVRDNGLDIIKSNLRIVFTATIVIAMIGALAQAIAISIFDKDNDNRVI